MRFELFQLTLEIFVYSYEFIPRRFRIEEFSNLINLEKYVSTWKDLKDGSLIKYVSTLMN